MAWNTIRKATETDTNKLNAAAIRFCDTHCLNYGETPYGEISAQSAVESAIEQDAALRKLWKRVVRRALNEPTADGIAYGYVGRFAQ